MSYSLQSPAYIPELRPMINKKSRGVSRNLLFHKPYGVLSKFTDSEGPPTLADYVDVPDVLSGRSVGYG